MIYSAFAASSSMHDWVFHIAPDPNLALNHTILSKTIICTYTHQIFLAGLSYLICRRFYEGVQA